MLVSIEMFSRLICLTLSAVTLSLVQRKGRLVLRRDAQTNQTASAREAEHWMTTRACQYVLLLNQCLWAMYLRGLCCRSSIFRSQAPVWGFKRSVGLQISHTPRRPEKERVNEGDKSDSKSSARDDGGRGEPLRGSIRPLTVFALCIPLGYGVNWALKKRDEAALSDVDGFVKYTLASKEDISTTCSIFTLKPITPSSAIRTDEPSLKRVITSVQLKQPQLQIARNYTLLPPKEGQDPQELSFLIRKERNGEVSGYLHRLAVGSEIELRGLSAEYVLPEKVDTVVFLAGGTGIAPAMQVADALSGKALVHILWASRRREDCAGGTSDTFKEVAQSQNPSVWLTSWLFPSSRVAKGVVAAKTSKDKGAIVAQLECLKQHSNSDELGSGHDRSKLLVDYYVDEEDTFMQSKDVQRLLQSASNGPLENDGVSKKLLFVAGPEGFVNYWASPKQWIGGREVQGPLGGVLSTLHLRGWEVVKL